MSANGMAVTATGTAPGILVECEGGCGAYVRPEDRFCDHCAELNHLYELKRTGNLRLREPRGTYARQDADATGASFGGTRHEASDLPLILESLDLRERILVALLGAGFLGLGACALALFVLGARVVIGWAMDRGF